MFSLFYKPVRRRTATPGVKKPGLASLPPRPGLASIPAFGSNPGALRMKVFAPPGLRAGRPLIVVLHGCGQQAATFAVNSGWVALANQYKLALLLPEQVSANNRGRCFNWFRSEDIKRGSGESMSIRQMIRSAVKMFDSDPRQIFVVGFSAGGGMAAALLAGYPALFAAGAVLAGMPVGSASTPVGAMLRMRKADTVRSRTALAKDAMLATHTPPRRRWPRMSIWQGGRDHTVEPANAEVLAAQWSQLHGYDSAPTTDQIQGGARRQVWGRPAKPPAVEMWTLAELGHGFPVDRGLAGGGSPGPWVVEAGISAARHIAAFWGIKR